MRTHGLKICLLLLLVSISGLAQAQTAQAPASAKVTAQQEIVKQARQSYYSLRAVGLDEFQSTVKPNWELILKDEIKSDPVQTEAALKLLNGLHFTMVLDQEGKVSVKHRTDFNPPNEQARHGFDQIYSGIDQAVSGFFATW